MLPLSSADPAADVDVIGGVALTGGAELEREAQKARAPGLT